MENLIVQPLKLKSNALAAPAAKLVETELLQLSIFKGKGSFNLPGI
jgi:hypothetical protein